MGKRSTASRKSITHREHGWPYREFRLSGRPGSLYSDLPADKRELLLDSTLAKLIDKTANRPWQRRIPAVAGLYSELLDKDGNAAEEIGRRISEWFTARAIPGSYKLFTDTKYRYILMAAVLPDEGKAGQWIEDVMEGLLELDKDTAEEALTKLLGEWPKKLDYIHAVAKLALGHQLIRQAFADRFAKVFDQELRRRLEESPPENYEAKKELAFWINDELRKLDLAIAHPMTGKPCRLEIGSHPRNDSGRFLFRYRGDRTTTGSMADLSSVLPFRLIEDPQRREKFLELNARIRHDRGKG
jgi:hypothetical protein